MRYMGGEQVEITLRALPDDVDFAIRLRAALKYCLRSCRLRCVALKDVPAYPGQEVSTGARFDALAGK